MLIVLLVAFEKDTRLPALYLDCAHAIHVVEQSSRESGQLPISPWSCSSRQPLDARQEELAAFGKLKQKEGSPAMLEPLIASLIERRLFYPSSVLNFLSSDRDSLPLFTESWTPLRLSSEVPRYHGWPPSTSRAPGRLMRENGQKKEPEQEFLKFWK